MNQTIESRPLSDIRDTFANFRIINPRADAAMVHSLELYGQISPVVCGRIENGLELLDGFKRLRASRHLKLPTIQTVLFETTLRACKAGIIQLNRVGRTITDIEEAMVLQSIYREDGLSMVEIATLVGRDKSWVSRRISLIERLDDDVRKNIELGLLCVSIGRELAKLPRGNQRETLSAVLKNRLGKREVEKLVCVLLSSPKWNWEKILSNAWNVISEAESTAAMTLSGFSRQLSELKRLQEVISSGASALLSRDDRPGASLLVTAIQSTRELEKNLERLLAGRNLEENQ